MLRTFLQQFYSENDLDSFFQILPTAPKMTTIRVNTLKCSRQEAKKLLEAHFAATNEPFTVLESEDFDDLLLIPSIEVPSSSIIPADKEIIVDAECGASLLRGAHLYAVGILGMDEGVEAGNSVSVWADLEGKCLKGSKRAGFSSKRLFIGNGQSQVSRSDVFGEGAASGIGVLMTEMNVKQPSLNGVLEAEIFLQNFPSIATAHALNPQPGSRVLDMCAAPGGKTCHLAALMQNKGSIVAFDKNKKKVAKIKENCTKLGVEIVDARVGDARRAQQLFPAESFDFILLDPPCSGLGQRPLLNPDCQALQSILENISTYSEYQAELFAVAWSLLKPNGTLVYSTCTVNPHENEFLIAKMCAQFPDAELVELPHGRAGLDGNEKVSRFWPSRKDDTIGFFIAKFRKQNKQ